MSASVFVLFLLAALAATSFLGGWLSYSHESHPEGKARDAQNLGDILWAFSWVGALVVLAFQHQMVEKWAWYVHLTIFAAVLILSTLGNIAAGEKASAASCKETA